MPHLDRDGELFVLTLGADENRFTVEWLAAMTALLDEVGAASAPTGLVLRAEGKFFSNGLDLDWLLAHGDEADGYVSTVQGVLARLLVLPMPTVAAVQGHCFAAGAMLALAADWRTMRADRGFFCLPEVDIGLPFTPGMDALIRAKLTPATALEAMTTGHRYGGAAALDAGIVTAACEEGEVLTRALDLLRPLAGKAGPTLGTIKARMFAEAVSHLLAEPKSIT